jgi:hypothetical protein
MFALAMALGGKAGDPGVRGISPAAAVFLRAWGNLFPGVFSISFLNGPL